MTRLPRSKPLVIAVALAALGRVAAADDEPLAGGTMFTLGGGVTDFIGDDMRAVTGNGGTWEARVAVATRRVVSFEVTYIGSAQTLDVPGLDPEAWLIGNGVEASVRFTLGTGAVQTLLVLGGGWRHYELAGDDVDESTMMPSDDVVTAPVGLGLLYRHAGFVFETRAVGRATLFSDLLPHSADRGVLEHWAMTAHVGIEL